MSPSLSTLTSLDLGKNGLKNGKLLAEFLSAAKSLQHFDAAWNQYNPEAGVGAVFVCGMCLLQCHCAQAYIAQSLIGNTALLSLSLQFNSFDDATGANAVVPFSTSHTHRCIDLQALRL